MSKLIGILFAVAVLIGFAGDAEAIGCRGGRGIVRKVVSRVVHPLQGVKDRRESRGSCESGSCAPASPMKTPSATPKKLP